MYFRGSGNGRERGMFRQIYLALITMKLGEIIRA